MKSFNIYLLFILSSDFMNISGLRTPALICVAPLIEAFLPSLSFKRLKVFNAILIVPKPSVIINVVVSSVPVIATPNE